VLEHAVQFQTHPYRYRRNLPHIQRADSPTFFTFATLNRLRLSCSARGVVLNACLFWDREKIDVLAAVVMPDHAHLICNFHRNESGDLIPFREVLQSIKGYSAYNINRLSGERGHIWQDESFNRVVRVDDDLRAKIEYLKENPVRCNLVSTPEQYPWLYVSPRYTAQKG
jgi:REP element-mobilizing transposase RayT